MHNCKKVKHQLPDRMIWIERENEEPARPRQDENKRRYYVTKEKAETFQVQSEKGRKCRVRIKENCFNKIICTSGERKIYEVTCRLI